MAPGPSRGRLASVVPSSPLAVNFLSAQSLITTFGVAGIVLILFAETGLLLGFFLPGDSLLFLAGYATAGGIAGVRLSLPVLLVVTPLAAIAGAQVGYLIGKHAGPPLFDREDSRLFRRSYVTRADDVLQRFGEGKAIFLARFVPVVRTFMNPVAGVTGTAPAKFLAWNIAGGLVWTVGIVLLGHALGNVEFIAKHLEVLILLVVLISVLPILVEVLRERSRTRS